jgi:glycosyltransferase involved in cell wall biosynthesis
VLICTRNRAARLKEVLTSATRLRVPPGLRWELVVVDNGSSDATTDVALGFSSQLPLRLVREETPGLSHARNRGVSEARGRYICWTDDDVLIDPDWLAAYAAAFERHPGAVVFGGRIIPVLESPSPRWFARLANEWPLTTLLAKRDFGDEPIALDLAGDIVPWGANYAVRAAEQRKVRYHPELGVSPRQRRLGEEAEVIFQLMNAGGSGWWVPQAEVRHITPAQRQTWRYVYEYFLAYGETVAYMERHWPGAHHMSANLREVERSRGGPGHLRLRAVLSFALYGASRLTGATHRSVKSLVRAGFYVGASRVAAGSDLGAKLVDRPAKRVLPGLV